MAIQIIEAVNTTMSGMMNALKDCWNWHKVTYFTETDDDGDETETENVHELWLSDNLCMYIDGTGGSANIYIKNVSQGWERVLSYSYTSSSSNKSYKIIKGDYGVMFAPGQLSVLACFIGSVTDMVSGAASIGIYGAFNADSTNGYKQYNGMTALTEKSQSASFWTTSPFITSTNITSLAPAVNPYGTEKFDSVFQIMCSPETSFRQIVLDGQKYYCSQYLAMKIDS